jgi:hypothetical protein
VQSKASALEEAASRRASPKASQVPAGVDQIFEALKSLSPEENLELVLIKDEVDTTLCEAHAMEQAASAVAQVSLTSNLC